MEEHYFNALPRSCRNTVSRAIVMSVACLDVSTGPIGSRLSQLMLCLTRQDTSAPPPASTLHEFDNDGGAVPVCRFRTNDTIPTSGITWCASAVGTPRDLVSPALRYPFNLSNNRSGPPLFFFFFSFCSSPFIYSPNLFRYGSSGVQRLKTVWSPLEDRVISVSCRPPRDGSDEAKRPEYPHSRRSIDCLTPVSCCLAFSWQTSQPSFSRPNAPGMGK